MTALSPEARTRLIRICGIFGSSFDGERANAARMADELIRAHGLTWADVLQAPRPLHRGTDREAAIRCLACPQVLSDWETNFLRSLLGRRRGLTRKQSKILDEIYEKVSAYEAARRAA